MDDKNLSDMLNDPLFSDYLLMNDNSLRFAISRISAQCEAIKYMIDGIEDYDDEEEEVNDHTEYLQVTESLDDIVSTCFRLMQIAELHRMMMMSDPKKDAKKTVFDLLGLTESIAKNCRDIKNNRCTYSASGEKNIYLEMNKEMLIFLIMCFIRKSIASGAETIDFESGKTEGLPYLKINVKLTGKKPTGLIDDFFLKRFSELVSVLSQALGCKTEHSDSEMTVSFSESCISKTFTLHASVPESELPLFNIYSTMLNDLFEGF